MPSSLARIVERAEQDSQLTFGPEWLGSRSDALAKNAARPAHIRNS